MAKNGSGVVWLHVPSIAAGPENRLSEWDLAQSVFSGVTHPKDIGSPFAVVRWKQGILEIVNDMLGLVRLFHLQFRDGDIWTTRPGLAHIFMGEPPKKNRLAWAGMASIGWATSGSTQLGTGRQLPGGSYVRAGHVGDSRFLTTTSNVESWVEDCRTGTDPTPAENVKDIAGYMATAARWPAAVTADLTGGKDSRVVAAVGIRNGLIGLVKTINKDSGEVETARRLVSLLEPASRVEHEIIETRDPSLDSTGFLERLKSQHTAFEGRLPAPAAYRRPRFTGFTTPRLANYNGLGGEVMAGGNLLGTRPERFLGQPVELATDRLATIARGGIAVSEDARDIVTSDITEYVARAESLGITDAAGVMDLFYDFDKMPNWSPCYSRVNTITPLFAPSVLVFAVRRMGDPMAYGEAHRRLLREAMPTWTSIPFYKGHGDRRVEAFLWQNNDWAAVQEYIRPHLELASSFDPDAVNASLRTINDGGGSRRDEILMYRVVWELSFELYLEELTKEATNVAAEIEILRQSPDHF